MTNKRITIAKHHQKYISQIAVEMECSEAEALNQLIWVLKQQNYHFGSPIAQYPITNDQQHYDPSTFEQATVMSGLAFQPQSPQAIGEFEQLQAEIDPIIARMALLVDEF